MKTLVAFVIALFAATALTLPDSAEAKRFGGGKSFGKSYQTPKRQAATPQRQQTSQQNAAAGAQAGQKSGMSKWLGPLAGLAAGGLLASMFFGGAFEGMQAMDWMLIALLAFGGFMLFKALRRKQAPAQQRVAYGGPAAGPGGNMPQSNPFGGAGQADARMDAAAPAAAGPSIDAPGWFRPDGFADGAKTHFIRLQAAWDKGDFRDISEYTAPALFAEIQRERQALEGPQYTEVVRLDAELVAVQRDGAYLIASVLFSGLIREGENETARRFAEVWHVQHDWDQAEGDWLINGIEQVEQ